MTGVQIRLYLGDQSFFLISIEWTKQPKGSFRVRNKCLSFKHAESQEIIVRKYIESTTGALEKHTSSMKEYISWDIIGGDPGGKKTNNKKPHHVLAEFYTLPYLLDERWRERERARGRREGKGTKRKRKAGGRKERRKGLKNHSIKRN